MSWYITYLFKVLEGTGIWSHVFHNFKISIWNKFDDIIDISNSDKSYKLRIKVQYSSIRSCPALLQRGANHKKSTHFITNRVVWFQYTIVKLTMRPISLFKLKSSFITKVASGSKLQSFSTKHDWAIIFRIHLSPAT